MVNLPTIDMTKTGQNIKRLRKQADFIDEKECVNLFL